MINRDPHTDPSVANPDINLAGVQYERNVGAEYGDHVMNTGAICNTSASHTYGNVLAVVEKYILTEIFPPDLFKTVTASTTLASRQIRHLPNQLYKKELPVMVLIPRIVFGQGENRFLGDTLINSRTTNTHSLYGDGSLLFLAEDKKRALYVNGHYNRAVMYIDIVLSFDTYAEQVNWLSHYYNTAPINHNEFVRAPLELFIPREFCELISNVADVPIDENSSVYKFLTYMNSIFYHPITYKLKGGSNSDEFFMYYIADIDLIFDEAQYNNGIKDGQIRRGYEISFTVRCDFNTVGYFTLNAPRINKKIHLASKDTSSGITPIFSDVINLNDFILPIGWSILGWPIFKLNYGENKISIDNILNQSLRTVIDYHLATGMPMERFIQIQFRENGEILNDELFYIDWGRRELVIIEPNYHRTYRLIIMVSHDYINNMVKDIYNLE